MARLPRLTALAVVVLSYALLATAHLSLDMEKKFAHEDDAVAAHLRARAIDTPYFNVQDFSGNGMYCLNMTVGTPPQMQTVLFDTGSSDLWFLSTIACASDPSSCRGGTFDASQSSTINAIDKGAFHISYAENSGASGDYVSDVVGIGNVQIPNVEFGLASVYNTPFGPGRGILGVGYTTGEVVNGHTGVAVNYPNFIDVLHQAGITQSRLYSVWLGDNGLTTTGNLIFGGIDTSRYTGPLVMVDTLNIDNLARGQLVHQLTTVTGLSLNNSGSVNTVSQSAAPQVVNMDTGSAFWLLPTEWYNSIVTAWNLTFAPDKSVSCSHLLDNFSLQVEFAGSITIDVPAKNLLMPMVNWQNNTFMVDGNGDPRCALCLSPSDDLIQAQGGVSLLGDAIMRSMYLVYDLDNGQMGFAQSNPNPGQSNVIDVPFGPGQIASILQGQNGGLKTAAPNTWIVPSEIPATANMTFSTVSPIDTATGVNALPTMVRMSGAAQFSVVNAAGSTIDPFARTTLSPSLSAASSTSSSGFTSATADATTVSGIATNSGFSTTSSSTSTPSPSKGAAAGSLAESTDVTRVLAVWLGLLAAGFLFNL